MKPDILSRKKFLHSSKTVLVAAVFLFLIIQRGNEHVSRIAECVLFSSGVLFGKVTCGRNWSKRGSVFAVAAFAFVNFVHSVIDGIVLSNLGHPYQLIALFGHEFIRQPLLYGVAMVLLEPFGGTLKLRILTSFCLVTMIWLLGMKMGRMFEGLVSSAEWLHPWLSSGLLFFAGDIAHHLYDERRLIEK